MIRRSSFVSAILSELKTSMGVALPLVASQMIYALSGFFATFMVAYLGKEALATHSLVWSIYLTSIVFFMGILFSISIMVSQSFGAKDNYSIKVCFNQGIFLAIFFTPIMMLYMWLCPIILVWTNQDPTVIELAKAPSYALIWAMLPFNIMIVLQHLFIGINKAYLVTIMSILAVPVEIFFFYVLLFGKLGFPKLGLAGIGYGITISYSLIIFPFLCYLFFAKQFKIYQLFKDWWKIDLKILFELVRLGLPLGSMFLIEVGLFAAVAILMGKLGTNTLAAYQISYQYIMIALVIVFALIQSTTVRVGTEVGRNNRKSLRLAAAINMAIGLGAMAGFSLVYNYFPRFLIGLEIDVKAAHSRELVKEASKFLSVIGIVVIIECIRMISIGALRGLKDTKIPMVISFVGLWCVAFPCSYLLGFKFKLGGVGLWYGVAIGLSVSAMILFFRFNRLSKRINLEKLVTHAEK